jgi:hypothetical protein
MKIVYSADDVLQAVLDDVDFRDELKNVLGSKQFVAKFVYDANEEMTGEVEVSAAKPEDKSCQSE